MPFSRLCLLLIVFVLLAPYAGSPLFGAHSPLGILTLATHAHLADAEAFPGLSVFEGEASRQRPTGTWPSAPGTRF